MRRIILLLVLNLAFIYSHAQLYDAQWVFTSAPSVLDFREPGIVWQYQISMPLSSFLTSANICDAKGNLLYYTNGVAISNANDTLPDGSGLNPCAYTSSTSCCGLGIPQAAIFIPMPDDTEFYYLFHYSYDTLDSSRPGTIYYTLIDNSGNGGAGSIVRKNVPILSDVVLRGGGMTACKHANGRDYWLIMGASVINKFYEFLITPDSILGPYTQKIGPDFPLPYDVAYSKFSQDGSMFASGVIEGPIVLMNFDRCSGEFTNPINIYHNASSNPATDPINGCASLEFSPNGQFLYVNNLNDLTQYNLLDNNIQDSVELYVFDSTDQYEIGMLQLAPNGKLYGSTWNGGLSAIHVVNYPDSIGNSADFVYGGQPTLTQNSYNLPNLINYNLGPLIGSGCDTILSIQNPKPIKQEPRIMPNPADKYIYVEMGMQGDYEFELMNSEGQVIANKQTHQVDIFDTESLAGGVYLVRVLERQSNTMIGVQKVVVAH